MRLLTEEEKRECRILAKMGEAGKAFGEHWARMEIAAEEKFNKPAGQKTESKNE